VAADRLLAYGSAGSSLFNVAAPRHVVAMVALQDTLVLVVEPGIVVWLDAKSGEEAARQPVGGQLHLSGSPDGACLLDRASGRGWILHSSGGLSEPAAIHGADKAVFASGRYWYVTRHDTLLHGGPAPIELGVGPDMRGDIVVCVGSVWVSVPDGLLRVGSWDGQLGPLVPAPEGPVPHLACQGGRLVGGSGRQGLFVLDVAADADARHIDIDAGGDLTSLVATTTAAWAFPTETAVARVVPLG
jgi:hypothetical protein